MTTHDEVRRTRGDGRALTTALAVTLGALLAGSAGAQPSHPRRAPAPADLVVVARVEAVENTPACGVLFSSPVVRHTVLRVVRGAYTSPTLYAFYSCGWSGGTTSVAPGTVLRLSLTRRPRRAFGTTVDRMGDTALPRFFVERAAAP